MASTDLIARLAEHNTIKGTPSAELDWLVAHGTLRNLAEGEILSAKGVPVAGLFVVLTGHVALFVDRGSGRRKALVGRAGDVAGMLPYSRLVSPPGDSVALEPSEILAIPRADLADMIRDCHHITTTLVHKMLDRSRVMTSSDLHDEKLVSLGKLSAGLAHELNNPASAIERSASLLGDRLGEVERGTRALIAAQLSEAELAAADAVRGSCVATRVPGVLSPIQQAEREDAIADWLADHGVESAVAGPLAETAVTIEALNGIAGAIRGPALSAALQWAAASCAVGALASEIEEAAMRISGLVTAVKGFTHMDQATVAEPVDVESTLNTTVVVLRSKARSKSATVTVTVDAGLPRARGFVGELNQIWANLIDNALDAVPESGRVEVVATNERQRIVVRVINNGDAIPDEIRARLFEPFFTTKAVGKGTGLGLDIVRRLIAHNEAEIDFDSEPGRTEFRVSLPIAETGAAATTS